MQADVFKDLCASIWEHQPENFPHHSRDIALQICNPLKVQDLPGTGTFAVLFPDRSIAICGNRGASIVTTFNFWDQADDEQAMDERHFANG